MKPVLKHVPCTGTGRSTDQDFGNLTFQAGDFIHALPEILRHVTPEALRLLEILGEWLRDFAAGIDTGESRYLQLKREKDRLPGYKSLDLLPRAFALMYDGGLTAGDWVLLCQLIALGNKDVRSCLRQLAALMADEDRYQELKTIIA